MRVPRNMAGPKIRELRSQKGMTQPMLAAKCNLLGWDLSRETLAKIETQIRWIADGELLCLAKALGVKIEELLPPPRQTDKALKEFFARFNRDF